jgi:hypothetical protein
MTLLSFGMKLENTTRANAPHQRIFLSLPNHDGEQKK